MPVVTGDGPGRAPNRTPTTVSPTVSTPSGPMGESMTNTSQIVPAGYDNFSGRRA